MKISCYAFLFVLAGALFSGSLAHAQDGGPAVEFVLDEASAAPGEQVTLAITLNGFEDVNGVQFSLDWNPDVLEYESVGNFGLPGLGPANFETSEEDAEQGRRAVVWSSGTPVTVDDGTAMFEVTFTGVGEDGESTDVLFADEPTERKVFVNFGPATFVGVDGSARLPVELSAFEAVVDDAEGAVVLAWHTASETNNDGFVVEQRRAGGGAFERIGYVAGAGTTTEAQRYTHRAEGLAPGTYAFRLKQMDRDGAYTYSPTVEATVRTAAPYQLSHAYPNPARGRAEVSLVVGEAQEVAVELFDVLGRRVAVLHRGPLAADAPHRFAVNGARLPSGLYFVLAAGETFSASRSVTLLR